MVASRSGVLAALILGGLGAGKADQSKAGALPGAGLVEAGLSP